MFSLRLRRHRRDLLRRFESLAFGAAVVLTMAVPAGATSVLGIPVGKNGLPATWIGEAVTVAAAFALPALVAGLAVGFRRATRRLGTRGVVLVAAIATVTSLGAVAVDQQPELLTKFTEWIAG